MRLSAEDVSSPSIGKGTRVGDLVLLTQEFPGRKATESPDLARRGDQTSGLCLLLHGEKKKEKKEKASERHGVVIGSSFRLCGGFLRTTSNLAFLGGPL